MTRRISAIFRNAQWEVTRGGIVSRKCAAPYRYQIDAEDLLAVDCHGGRSLYDWPIEVTRKTWVEPELFFEAFAAALTAHEGEYDGTVNTTLLKLSLDEARRRCRGQ
jgi:hypothetical protein